MKVEKPIIIELYEFWNKVKARFNIISPQPKSFELLKTVQPVTNIDSIGVELVDLSSSTSVAAAGVETQQLKPPDGVVYEIIDVFYTAPDPAGSGAGSHRIYCGYTNMFDLYIFRIISAFGNALYIRRDTGFTGTTSESPSNIAQQMIVFNGLIVSNSQPIDFWYSNGTDVAQAGTRTLQILVKKYPEGAF